MKIPTKNGEFYRDSTNGALINTNLDELKMRKAQRDFEASQQNEIKSLRDELEELKRLIRSGKLDG